MLTTWHALSEIVRVVELASDAWKIDGALPVIVQNGDNVIIISDHVDDTNILSPSLKNIEWLKEILDVEYSIEDFGPTSYFLGIELVHNKTNKI